MLNTNSLRALEKLADEVFVFRNGTIAKKLRGEKIAPRTILDHLGGAQAASEAPRPQRETLFAIQGSGCGDAPAPSCCTGVRYSTWWTMT